MVREVRAARECSHCEERSEALVPMAVAGEHTAATSLPAEVVEVVHRVTTDASRITGSWASARIAALDAAPYSEIIGTVAIVNALDGWVLTPLIAGKATNLDPVTIFVAVLAGGSVMGAYGMLIAIPIAACLKILLSDLVVPKLREMGQRPKARDATDASAV